MEVLQKIAELKQELDELRPLDRAQELAIMQKFRLDWNYHSNNLEGNSLTYGETKALLLFNITAQGKPLQDHIEISGHNDALKWVEEVVKQDRPLNQAFIRDLHQLILKESYEVDAITPEGKPTKKKVLVGEYKQTPNHVKTKTGEIFRFATPEETPARMADLLDWYESEKATRHPLLLAAEFHYKFIRIHPFDDGNGRTARILMNFILMQSGFPPVIIKTEDKQNYFAVLRQADAGIIEPFIEYIGENLVHSLEIMIKGAKGENIDEPDDVDKEIALIEQRLKGLDGKVEKLRSEEIVQNLLNSSIKLFAEKFSTACGKYEKFYDDIQYSFYIEPDLDRDPFDILPRFNYDSHSLIKRIEAKLALKPKIKELKLIFYFNHFSRRLISAFSYHSGFTFVFRKNEYILILESTNNKQETRKLYNEKLAEKEIEKLILDISKAHNSYINEQIARAEQETEGSENE